MSTACACGQDPSSLGTPSCTTKIEAAKQLLLTSLFDSSGAEQVLDVVNEINKSGIQAKIDETNALDRFQPLGLFENIEDVRADSVFQEFESGKQVFIRDGSRTFNGFIPGASNILVGKLNTWRCTTLGAYYIDKASSFVYESREGDINNAYPVPIDKDTFRATYVKATDSEVAGVLLQFQWAESHCDEDLRAKTGNDFDFATFRAPIEVTGQFSSITTTSFDVEIYDCYSTADAKNYVEGLGLLDFTLSEISPTPGVISLDSVTENTPGNYTIDYTSMPQTSGDVLRLTFTKSGFDPGKLASIDITIP